MDILFVDISKILGESLAARLASEALQKRWKKSKEAAELRRLDVATLQGAAYTDALEEIEAALRLVMQELEEQRQLLRHEVLEKASFFVSTLAIQRGAAAVLRKDAALYIDPALDITDDVMELLDRAARRKDRNEEATTGRSEEKG